MVFISGAKRIVFIRALSYDRRGAVLRYGGTMATTVAWGWQLWRSEARGMKHGTDDGASGVINWYDRAVRKPEDTSGVGMTMKHGITFCDLWCNGYRSEYRDL